MGDEDEAAPRVGTHLASMMTLSEVGIDFERANAARIYDYFLGGGAQLRQSTATQAAHVIAALPRHRPRPPGRNRAFLGRAVRWCLAQGIDQFLDLGSGVPTVGNVHEIALAQRPRAPAWPTSTSNPSPSPTPREIVADLDTGSRSPTPTCDQPHEVLAAPGVAGLLDPARPVALLAVGVLHFVARRRRRRSSPLPRRAGARAASLVLNHTSVDHDDPDARRPACKPPATPTAAAPPNPTVRDRREIRELRRRPRARPARPRRPRPLAVPVPDAEPIGAYAAVGRIPV